VLYLSHLSQEGEVREGSLNPYLAVVNQMHQDAGFRRPALGHYADYSMYSTFLTASPGSVLFSRSNLLKRKDLCFSCLRLGLIRHRRSLRSSHLSSQVFHDLHRVTLENVDLLRKGFANVEAQETSSSPVRMSLPPAVVHDILMLGSLPATTIVTLVGVCVCLCVCVRACFSLPTVVHRNREHFHILMSDLRFRVDVCITP
jgi:hypothetical protein